MDEGTKIENAFHDWYSDRWNNYYADADEPGWAITFDVKALLKVLMPKLTAKQLKAAIAKVDSDREAQAEK